MSHPSPLLLRILDYFLPPELDHLIGDLEEEFNERRVKSGIHSAHVHLWFHVITSLPLLLSQIFSWNLIMLANYVKTTWRNIKKHKSFSLINVLGLSISMSVCLLIIVFIVDQKSYDRFHEKGEDIYRVISDYKSPSNNSNSLYATTPANLSDIIENELPGTELATTLFGDMGGEFRYSETTVPLEGIYAEPSFLEVFNFELLKGDPETALEQPGSILLTPESASKIFGDEDPMGKVITELGNRDYQVTGIINSHVKSHFRLDINEAIVSYSTLTSSEETNNILQNWKQSIYNSYTYVLLDPRTEPAHFEEQLSSLIPSHFTDPEQEAVIQNFELQQLHDINLGTVLSNEIGIVFPQIIGWFLAAFALIIILIACFNYVSLTGARAITRSREVGVRKVMGAYRSNIIKQFLTESVVIAIIALFFAWILLRVLIPEFNSLTTINFTKSQIIIDWWDNYTLYFIFLVFSVFVGMLAGLYPAMYLSNFEPARVLKGIMSVRGLSGKTLRKIITVTQFSFSILFIITALILAHQFNHVLNTDYGFDQEGIVNVALQDVPFTRLENALLEHPEVEKVAAASHVPAQGRTRGVWLESDSLDQRLRGNSFQVNEKYIETIGLTLVNGRNFEPNRSTDSSSAVIVSEETVRQLNLGNLQEAIGQNIRINEEDREIIGVIQNFISSNPFEKGNPIVLLYQPDQFYYAVVKIKQAELTSFLDKIDGIWSDVSSLHSLQYMLFDEQMRESPLLLIFTDFIKVIGLISLFSVFISCLGLLGMALYSAENRVKEIGIRKVLGATGRDIVVLLSKEYLLLILIAIAIGTPLSWFVNNLWLQQISNKIDLSPWIFIIGILGTTALALLTVGSQAVRAARINSIDNLRKE